MDFFVYTELSCVRDRTKCEKLRFIVKFIFIKLSCIITKQFSIFFIYRKQSLNEVRESLVLLHTPMFFTSSPGESTTEQTRCDTSFQTRGP